MNAYKQIEADSKSFSQRGVSLVEIMISLVLSLILVAGVGQIYLGSKQTYRMQDGQSRLQENARYAVAALTRDIRAAGYLGCQSTCPIIPTGTSCPSGYQLINQCCQLVPFVIGNSPLIAPNTAIALPAGVVSGPYISGGNDNTGSWANPRPALSNDLPTASDGGTIVQGTDAITVVFGESCGGTTSAAMSTVDPATATLSSQHTCGSATNPGTAVPVNTPLVIADCHTAHIFRAATNTTKNTSGGVATSSLGKTYNASVSEIMRFRSYTYYIRINPSNQPALYRYDNNTDSSLELVEGIEDMQILYGVDTIRTPPSSANQYLVSTSVGNWAQVVSVRITLTVRSVGENSDNLTNVPNAARSYDGDANYIDRRVVKTFVTTISLRNRMQ